MVCKSFKNRQSPIWKDTYGNSCTYQPFCMEWRTILTNTNGIKNWTRIKNEGEQWAKEKCLPLEKKKNWWNEHTTRANNFLHVAWCWVLYTSSETAIKMAKKTNVFYVEIVDVHATFAALLDGPNNSLTKKLCWRHEVNCCFIQHRRSSHRNLELVAVSSVPDSNATIGQNVDHIICTCCKSYCYDLGGIVLRARTHDAQFVGAFDRICLLFTSLLVLCKLAIRPVWIRPCSNKGAWWAHNTNERPVIKT